MFPPATRQLWPVGTWGFTRSADRCVRREPGSSRYVTGVEFLGTGASRRVRPGFPYGKVVSLGSLPRTLLVGGRVPSFLVSETWESGQVLRP